MKVCLITGLYVPFVIAGPPVTAKLTAEGLVDRGHEVLVITAKQNRSGERSVEEINGVKIYRFYPLNIYSRTSHPDKPILIKAVWQGIDLWNVHSYQVVKHILKKEMPDVVHIHYYEGLSTSVFSAVKSLDLPLVYTPCSYGLVCPRGKLLRSSGEVCTHPRLICQLFRKFTQFAVENKPDVVTFQSQFIIDKLKENGFFRNTKTMKLLAPTEVDKTSNILKAYDIIDILYAGQLVRAKGVHILLNAFKQLKYDNIRLHIAGQGPDEGKFREIAGNDPRITFYGWLPEEKLTELYKRANVTVVPSLWYEVFGIIIIESFKYGTPVVASNIGGMPEIVEKGHNGFLFEAGDVEALKRILESLIENPAQLERLGQGAFESAKKYDVSCNITELVVIYEEAVARHAQTTSS